MRRVIPDPWSDNWPDAARNSLGCFELAIAEMRRRLVEQQAQSLAARLPVTAGLSAPLCDPAGGGEGR